MLPLLDIFLLSLIPAAGLLLGGCLAFAWRPGAQTRSGIQHFTAGVVIAAVAAELVPALHVTTSPLPMAIGFLFGILAMLAVRRFAGEGHDGEDHDGHGDGADQEADTGALLRSALVVAVAVDLLVDGLLAGVTLANSLQGGLVIVGALSLEVLFLGLALLVSLRNRGLGRAAALVLLAGLAVLLPVGGIVGPLVLRALPAEAGIGVMAFATAALLYLVFEELLAEAHEGARDSSLTTALLFLGFLAVLLIKAVLE
ncbi:ZIP family metal transporter [Marinibaculum pumilum]|uniref:ZIP family metal transporter n=1 Tax=Marinibaculum pumilum TaxID=1766165 RepID=A0ABV7KVN7_9PROT